MYDAQHMLNWQDPPYATDPEAMYSSLTPIVAPVQLNRPFTWLNGDASRVPDEISGADAEAPDTMPAPRRRSADRTGGAIAASVANV